MTLSSQVFISSKAASLVFQFASANSVAIDDGTNSAANASASSGVCLYLNVSRAPGGAVAAGLGVFDPPVAVAGGFLAARGAAAVAGAEVAGFLVYA